MFFAYHVTLYVAAAHKMTHKSGERKRPIRRREDKANEGMATDIWDSFEKFS